MDEEDYTMNIRKIVAASAIALTFGLVATAQAGNIDHVTADTNPAVFGTTGSAYMSTAQVMNVDHITEATKPDVFGSANNGILAEKKDTGFSLPYQRG